MIDQIKSWLGIEGVKAKLVCSDFIKNSDTELGGHIQIISNKDAIVYRIEFHVIEKYQRGKGVDKLIDDYVWAVQSEDMDVFLPAKELIEIPFNVRLNPVLSNMDKMEKNPLLTIPVKIAKFAKGVDSQIWVEATISVRGNASSFTLSKQLMLR